MKETLTEPEILLLTKLWCGNVLQNELKGLHEAQADDGVLQQFDFKTYASALMNVSLATQEISVTHSFAVVSSFSKRLKLMKTHKTRLGKTLGFLSLFTILSFGIVGWTTLKSQEKDTSKDTYPEGACCKHTTDISRELQVGPRDRR